MKKIQIQLPDHQFEQLRKIAKEREISIAEILRRGAEYCIRISAASLSSEVEWIPPKPIHLGEIKISASKMREIAMRSDGDLESYGEL